jgi:transposase
MSAMMILPYAQILKDTQEPLQFRLEMVKRYQECGSISQVAREFRTTRKTVRKWVVERFCGSLGSLKNRSRAPKVPREHLSAQTKEALDTFKREYPGLGYQYLSAYLVEHGITELPSKSGVYALWRKRGLLPKRRSKSQRKRDCRQIKAKYRPFEKIQIDVKELRDIPNYLEQTLALRLKHQQPQRGLPLFQYTARDMKTGTLFFAYAYEHTQLSSAIFADRILTHLGRFGITPRIIQTDNGTEFVDTRNALNDTLFIQVVTRNRQTEHRRIPPGAKTFQSDVESSHWIIEREFYDFVKVRSDQNLVDKARAYQWGFNVLRKNGYRGNKTPLEILREEDDDSYAKLPKEIMDFPLCILDEKVSSFLKGGYHVPLPAIMESEFLKSETSNPVLFHRPIPMQKPKHTLQKGSTVGGRQNQIGSDIQLDR